MFQGHVFGGQAHNLWRQPVPEWFASQIGGDKRIRSCFGASPPCAVERQGHRMSEVMELRERARRCREIAKDYHPSVGAPLYVTAADLEREAARIERGGGERRGLFG